MDRMSDREFACWVVGSTLTSFGLTINGVGYWSAKAIAIKADAWVGVAHEIGGAIASLGGG